VLPTLTPYLTALGAAGVLVLMGVVFVETGLLLGFFLPGDSLLFTAGVLAAAGALPLPLWLVALGVFVAATAGDQVGYLIGRKIGPRVFNRPQSRLFARRHADRAHAFVARYGPRAIVLARFVPVVRTFAPTVTGVGRMPYRQFVTYNVVGALAWGVGVLTAGYFLGGVPIVAAHVEVVLPGVVAVSLVPAGLALVRRCRSRAREPNPEEGEEAVPELAA
jgi:membrane-associated protein